MGMLEKEAEDEHEPKNKVNMLGWERVPHQVEVRMNVETMKFVKMRLVEGQETFDTMRKLLNIMIVSLCKKREFYDRDMVVAVTYGAETRDLRIEQRRKQNLVRKKSLRSICAVTRGNRRR